MFLWVLTWGSSCSRGCKFQRLHSERTYRSDGVINGCSSFNWCFTGSSVLSANSLTHTVVYSLVLQSTLRWQQHDDSVLDPPVGHWKIQMTDLSDLWGTSASCVSLQFIASSHHFFIPMGISAAKHKNLTLTHVNQKPWWTLNTVSSSAFIAQGHQTGGDVCFSSSQWEQDWTVSP